MKEYFIHVTIPDETFQFIIILSLLMLFFLVVSGAYTRTRDAGYRAEAARQRRAALEGPNDIQRDEWHV